MKDKIKNITDEAFGAAVLKSMIMKYGNSIFELLEKNFTKRKYPEIDYIRLGKNLRNMLLAVKTEEELKIIDRVFISFTGICLSELLVETEEYNIEEKGPFEVSRTYEDNFLKFLEDIGADSYGGVNNFTDLETNTAIDNDIFTLRPYYWGDDEKIQELPNFVYKPDGLEISWYKYPFRGACSNKKITRNYLNEIIAGCKSIMEKEKK